MKNEYWAQEDGDEKQIIKKLKNSGLSSDIAAIMADQIAEVSDEINNYSASSVIFIFAYNNELIVTCIHVPSDALNGEDGPILMRGANDKSIVAAFSRDFIAERLRQMELLEEESAGLPDELEHTWMAELGNLAEMVRIEIARNPPESWDQLLDGEY